MHVETTRNPCFVLQLQQDVWREVLEFASAALPSSAEPDLLAASSPASANVKALLGSQHPVGLRQKLHLLQQFQAWHREQAVLKPLALPRLPIKVCLLVAGFSCAWHRTDTAVGERQPLCCLTTLPQGTSISTDGICFCVVNALSLHGIRRPAFGDLVLS